MKKRFPFPKRWRIHSTEEFRGVFSKAKPFGRDHIVIYATANERPYSRIGISISKKVGGTIRRNRLKRLIREVYRMNRERIKQGVDIVFVVKPGCDKDDFRSMEACVLELFKRGGLLEGA